MKQITENPFRIIGLLADCSEKDIQKQKSKINAFINVGKTISTDFDFTSIGALHRNDELIAAAFSKIEQSANKLNHALLWFTNGNHLDEPAFSHLKDGNIEKAEEIWTKPIRSSEITERNTSLFNNLSTLKLALAFSNDTVNLNMLSDAIDLKSRLILSNSFESFAHKIGGENLTINRKYIINHFADCILAEISPYLKKGLSLSSFINTIASTQSEFFTYASSKLTDKPLHEIEISIELAKKGRNQSPEKGYNIGATLFTNTKENLLILKTLLGGSNMQYQVIADKLAKEVLQCGIDYFQEHRDKDAVNPGDDTMKLFKIAKSIAIGTQTKERVTENTEGLQEWIDDKPERDKQKKIADDLLFITSKLETFQNLNDTIANAKDLIVSSKPKLTNIKTALGAYDDFYLKVSSAIVSNAQGMMVAVVNKSQDAIKHAYDNATKLAVLLRLKNILSEAVEATNLMGTLDMLPDVRSRYNTNKDSLLSLKNQIDSVTAPRSGSGNRGNCYIATMAYGSYDHPQVIKLRHFRDNTLSKFIVGRTFIKMYYYISPEMVKYLKGFKPIHLLIRKMLNQIIKLIK